jgi:type VI secretion system protein VasD
MRSAHTLASILLAGLAVLALAGCGPKAPEPTRVVAKFQASPALNPDFQDRPSPIVVRFYELRSDSVFQTADFFQVYDEETQVLGPHMLAREELEVQPGEIRTLERELRPETQFIGVLAAYRDIEDAQWRASVEVAPNQTNELTVHLGRLEVRIEPASP